MKKMIDYLDADKDRVMSGLQGAATPEAAQQILEKEADRLLLQYNEECASVRVRDAAAGMMQAVRSSIPLLDSMGEARVWRREGTVGSGAGAAQTGKKAGMSVILLGIGAVLSAAAFLAPALMSGGAVPFAALLKWILLPVAGGACLYLAGRSAGKNVSVRIGTDPSRGPAAERIEILIDPEKLWSSLRGAMMVVDRHLEMTREEETNDLRKNQLTTGKNGAGITGEEVELFAGLLEMADADNPQMSADIRYYLHRRGVDVIEWSDQYAAWFEMLPSMSAGKDTGTAGTVTVRPALAQQGRLLKKGLAVR